MRVTRRPVTVVGGGGTGGTGGSPSRTLTQTAHGFTVGALTAVRYSAGAYVKSKADAAANADVWGLAIASDVDTFVLYEPGAYISGFSAITAGVNYLSAVAAGALTTGSPTAPGTVEKVLFMADSTTSGYFEPQIGIPIDSTPYAKQILAGNVAVTVANLGKIVIPSDLDGLALYACEVSLEVAPTGGPVTVGLRNDAGLAMFSTNPRVAVNKNTSAEAGGVPAVVNAANAVVAKGDILVAHGVTADTNAADGGLSYWLRFSL